MSVLAVYDCMLFFLRAARPERVRETFQLVEAPYLVTRDNDLLDLMSDRPDGVEFRQRFPAIKIVDPATFIAEIRGA